MGNLNLFRKEPLFSLHLSLKSALLILVSCFVLLTGCGSGSSDSQPVDDDTNSNDTTGGGQTDTVVPQNDDGPELDSIPLSDRDIIGSNFLISETNSARLFGPVIGRNLSNNFEFRKVLEFNTPSFERGIIMRQVYAVENPDGNTTLMAILENVSSSHICNINLDGVVLLDITGSPTSTQLDTGKIFVESTSGVTSFTSGYITSCLAPSEYGYAIETAGIEYTEISGLSVESIFLADNDNVTAITDRVLPVSYELTDSSLDILITNRSSVIADIEFITYILLDENGLPLAVREISTDVAIQPGSDYIYKSDPNFDGSSSTVRVIIDFDPADPEPNTQIDSITINPRSGNLTELDQTLQLSAEALNTAGLGLSDAQINWSSSNPGIVDVNSSGLVFARGNGSAIITASSGGIQDSVEISVSLPDTTIATITVTPSSGRLTQIGQTLQLKSSAFNATGAPLNLISSAWYSSDNSIATVNSGLVTAQGSGVATIRATNAGVNGFAEITVDLPPPVVPSISISDVYIEEGDSGTKNAAIDVNLSEPTTVQVSVNYTTEDGSASSDSDYRSRSGKLTFSPGELSKSIAIPIVGDEVREDQEEKFTLRLSNPISATLGSGKATITIDDGDDFGIIILRGTSHSFTSLPSTDCGGYDGPINVTGNIFSPQGVNNIDGEITDINQVFTPTNRVIVKYDIKVGNSATPKTYKITSSFSIKKPNGESICNATGINTIVVQ